MSGCWPARSVVSPGSSRRLARNSETRLLWPSPSAGVAGVADQFPVPFAHRPIGVRPLAYLPVHRVAIVRAGCVRIAQHRGQAAAIESSGGRFEAAQLGQRGQPIGGMGHRRASFVLWQGPRPGDDRRHADAAFKQAELRPAIGPGASAAKVGPLFGGMPVVALEDDDRALPQPQRIHFGQQCPQPFVLGRQERGVQIPRVRQVLEMLQPLRVALVRVVRRVQRVVDEAGTVLVLLQETRRLPGPSGRESTGHHKTPRLPLRCRSWMFGPLQ